MEYQKFCCELIQFIFWRPCITRTKGTGLTVFVVLSEMIDVSYGITTIVFYFLSNEKHKPSVTSTEMSVEIVTRLAGNQIGGKRSKHKLAAAVWLAPISRLIACFYSRTFALSQAVC